MPESFDYSRILNNPGHFSILSTRPSSRCLYGLYENEFIFVRNYHDVLLWSFGLSHLRHSETHNLKLRSILAWGNEACGDSSECLGYLVLYAYLCGVAYTRRITLLESVSRRFIESFDSFPTGVIVSIRCLEHLKRWVGRCWRLNAKQRVDG